MSGRCFYVHLLIAEEEKLDHQHPVLLGKRRRKGEREMCVCIDVRVLMKRGDAQRKEKEPGHEMERLLMRFLGGGRLPHPFFKFLLGGNSRQHRDEQHIYIGRDVDGRVVCVKRSGARTDGRPPWESLETLRRGEPRPSTHTHTMMGSSYARAHGSCRLISPTHYHFFFPFF
jgi:hypothetical protein